MLCMAIELSCETWECLIAICCCVLCAAALQGLEVEVQRLISRHRAELAAAADRAAEQTKSVLEAAKAQHEAALAAAKERLRQVGVWLRVLLAGA